MKCYTVNNGVIFPYINIIPHKGDINANWGVQVGNKFVIVRKDACTQSHIKNYGTWSHTIWDPSTETPPTSPWNTKSCIRWWPLEGLGTNKREHDPIASEIAVSPDNTQIGTRYFCNCSRVLMQIKLERGTWRWDCIYSSHNDNDGYIVLVLNEPIVHPYPECTIIEKDGQNLLLTLPNNGWIETSKYKWLGGAPNIITLRRKT